MFVLALLPPPRDLPRHVPCLCNLALPTGPAPLWLEEMLYGGLGQLQALSLLWLFCLSFLFSSFSSFHISVNLSFQAAEMSDPLLLEGADALVDLQMWRVGTVFLEFRPDTLEEAEPTPDPGRWLSGQSGHLYFFFCFSN